MNEESNSYVSKICFLVSALFGVLCIGALIRFELVLQEHRALIADIQDRTYCLKVCKDKEQVPSKAVVIQMV